MRASPRWWRNSSRSGVSKAETIASFEFARMPMRLTVKDAFGQPFELEEPARRVVSLIPSITETLFRLGAGDRVVGVSKFCTEPPDGVVSKTKVGGQKNPRVE